MAEETQIPHADVAQGQARTEFIQEDIMKPK